MLDRRFGEYLDAQPGGWLIFTAGGPLGSKRYACPEHRDDLTAYVRRHYGAVCHAGVHATEPYEAVWPDGVSGLDERELTKLSGDRRTTGIPAAKQPDRADRQALNKGLSDGVDQLGDLARGRDRRGRWP